MPRLSKNTSKVTSPRISFAIYSALNIGHISILLIVSHISIRYSSVAFAYEIFHFSCDFPTFNYYHKWTALSICQLSWRKGRHLLRETPLWEFTTDMKKWDIVYFSIWGKLWNFSFLVRFRRRWYHSYNPSLDLGKSPRYRTWSKYNFAATPIHPIFRRGNCQFWILRT